MGEPNEAGRTLRAAQVCREEDAAGVAALLKRELAAQAAEDMEPARRYRLRFAVGRAPLLCFAVAVELEVEPL
jgi:hypothetical protein